MFIVPDDMLEELTCDFCHKYLSVGPVKVDQNRRKKCGRCAIDIEEIEVTSVYQHFGENAIFKCINRFDGCEELLTYGEVTNHENECLSNKYECPLCENGLGMETYKLLHHIKNDHNLNYLKNSVLRKQLNEIQTVNKFLYLNGNFIFFIFIEFMENSGKLFLNAFHIGGKNEVYDVQQKYCVHIDGLRSWIETKPRKCLPWQNVRNMEWKIDSQKIDYNLQNEVIVVNFKFYIPMKIVTEMTYKNKMPFKNSNCVDAKMKSSKSKQAKGNGKKNINPPQAKISIPLGEEVQLHTAENPWRPARFAVGEFATKEDHKTKQLYKKVRGILNKLTPQKFDMLLAQIKVLQIDNSDRLQGIIDLVFNNAVEEPELSAVYAKMCKMLALMNVPIVNSGAAEGKEEVVYFDKILITRCEIEFEKHFDGEKARNLKLKEIDECTDRDKKKDLQIDLEEYDRELMIKSVGIVIFMGELFKQEMFASHTMVRCLNHLLENKDERSLECLCILLTTIGKELESKGVDLTQIFNTMKAIAEKKDNTEISSRIRFMLQDVIDFGQLKRVPPRQYLNPKILNRIPLKWKGRKKIQSDKLKNKAIGPDVKLHESEKPIDEDRKTKQLYKQFRRILKKLTLQNFDELLGQIKSLQIDNSDRLQGVIDLVFNKAIDNAEFSHIYAKMCKELAFMHVPMSNSSAPEKKEEFVNFRKILLTRCQMEFEKQTVDESTRNTKLKEIDECTNPDKKKDLQFDLEEYDRKLRMKSVGNVKFIGELFKQEMLTLNIMVKCLYNLLETKDEESLECLCKLLTTIGKELESKTVDLTHIFNTMKAIADKKENTKVSSRIRFMLQEVIDLRQSKWVPRRQDLNPKITPRKDDRMGGGGMGMSLGRKGGRGDRNISDDGLVTNKRSRGVFTLQSDKLKNKTPTIDEPFGSMSAFQNWGKGTQGPKFSSQQLTNKSNPYSALENNYMDSDKRLGSSQSKDPYSSKGPSLERISDLVRRSQDRSATEPSSGASSQRSTPAYMLPPLFASIGDPSRAPVSNRSTYNVPPMSDEQLERSSNSIDEYISGSVNVDGFFQAITSCIPTTNYSTVISTSYFHVFEKSQHDRLKTGELFAKLVKDGQFSLEDYCDGLVIILSEADDLKIDIPKFWDYLADILVHMVIEEVLPLDRLLELLKLQISQSDISKLIACIFKLIVAEKGAAVLQKLWQRSGLRFTDFLENAHVRNFVKDNQVEFLLDGSSWIMENVGDKVKENKFIRTLATAIFEDSISLNFKLKKDVLLSHTNLLLKYIDNNPHSELEGLYALQALIHKLEHPQGLLLEICTTLLDQLTISQESFIAWAQSNDPAEQEGKAEAKKQLTAFITQLKENDDDDDYTSEEEA